MDPRPPPLPGHLLDGLRVQLRPAKRRPHKRDDCLVAAWLPPRLALRATPLPVMLKSSTMQEESAVSVAVPPLVVVLLLLLALLLLLLFLLLLLLRRLMLVLQVLLQRLPASP